MILLKLFGWLSGGNRYGSGAGNVGGTVFYYRAGLMVYCA